MAQEWDIMERFGWRRKAVDRTPRQEVDRVIRIVLSGGTLLVGALFVAVMVLGSSASSSSLDAASSVALITAAAVGIERFIEAIWTAIGLFSGSWWPLTEIGGQLNKLLDEMDKHLRQYYEQAEGEVQRADELVQQYQALLDRAKEALDKVRNTPKLPNVTQLLDAERYMAEREHQLEDVQRVQADKKRILEDLTNGQTIRASVGQARNKQDALVRASIAVNAISHAQQLVPQLAGNAALVKQAAEGVREFVETFKDNPGRRLISIYVGVLLGMVVAWPLGLDIFQAVPGIELRAGFGVAVSGVIIGLGANPTHEVVRLLEEFKKSRQIKNTDTSEAV